MPAWTTEKYLLLQSKLKGSAPKELPEDLGESPYVQGWINLNSRYENRRVLIEQSLERYLNINPIVSNSHQSMLEGLQLMQQFQHDIVAYELELSDVMPTFEEFTSFLEIERAICERTRTYWRNGEHLFKHKILIP